MRQIKFRAWIPQIKTMLHNVTVYPDMIGLDAGDFEGSLPMEYSFDGSEIWCHEEDKEGILMTVLEGEDWVFLEEGQFHLMQFTGLMDKNGKEIYEGDIVRITAGEEWQGMRELDKMCPVKYVGASFCPVDKDDSCYDFGMIEEIEVIGNIYETPELL